MKKRKWPVVMLVFLVTIFCSNSVFATSSNTIKKEYKFTAKTSENLKYDIPKDIVEKGKKYVKTDKKVEYRIIKDNKMKVIKTVFSDKKSEESVAKEITKNGNALNLIKISWSENNEKVKAEKTVINKEELPSSISSTKKVDGEKVVIALSKKRVEEFTTPQNFTAPVKFIGHPNSPYYTFNNKVITLLKNEPNWEGWENDIKNHLGINNNSYEITSIAFTSDFSSLGNNQYQRIATVTGIRHVPTFKAFYEEQGAEYKGQAEYEGCDKEKEVEAVAIATYKEVDAGMSLKTKVLIGAFALIMALTIASIVFFLAKKRKNEA